MKKRDFLRFLGFFGASAAVSASLPGCDSSKKMVPTSSAGPVPMPDFKPARLRSKPFELPPLGYSFDALEPHFDKMTMEIHHDRHHKAYVDNLNKAVETGRFVNWELADIFSQLTADDAAAVRNHGGGHWNHSFFWPQFSAAGGGKPGGALAEAINASFGDFDKMKEQFSTAAKGVFGSGWAWLCRDGQGKLFTSSTPNQDNPLMKNLAKMPGQPLLSLDVWEHAYYLKFQNKRADFVGAFWNIVDWNVVAGRFAGK